MALEFRPPTDLINSYLNRPSPGQEASDAVNTAFKNYATQKIQEHKDKNDALGTIIKAADSLDITDPKIAQALAPLYKDAGIDPSIFQPPTASTATTPSPAPAPITAGLPDAQGVPTTTATPPASQVSPIVQAHLDAGHPDHSGVMASVGDPNQLIKTGYGRKKLAAAESAQKLTDSQQAASDKAEENSPKSFDYVRGLAKSSGLPDAAEPFISNAQKEGRSTLNRVEMKDLQNSITANASQKRGDFYEGSLDVKRQAQELAMTKFAMEQTGGRSLMDASKVATDRLGQLKRAEGVLDQISSQGDLASRRQAAEGAISTVKALVGSGVASDSQVNEFIPRNLKTKYRDWTEFLSSDASQSDFSSFNKEFKALVSREKGINQEIIGASQQFGAPAVDLLAQHYPHSANKIRSNISSNSLINPMPDVSAQAPASGPHGPTVTQNGHTYTWNGSNYE